MGDAHDRKVPGSWTGGVGKPRTFRRKMRTAHRKAVRARQTTRSFKVWRMQNTEIIAAGGEP